MCKCKSISGHSSKCRACHFEETGCSCGTYGYLCPFNQNTWTSRCNKALRDLVRSDLKTNRPIDPSEIYVDTHWIDLIKDFFNECSRCEKTIKYHNYKRYDPDRWSINRFDNKLPHYTWNCEVICLECNLILNRYTNIKIFMSININTQETKHWRNQREAARQLGVSHGNISHCLHGLPDVTKCYRFIYI